MFCSNCSNAPSRKKGAVRFHLLSRSARGKRVGVSINLPRRNRRLSKFFFLSHRKLLEIDLLLLALTFLKLSLRAEKANPPPRAFRFRAINCRIDVHSRAIIHSTCDFEECVQKRTRFQCAHSKRAVANARIEMSQVSNSARFVARNFLLSHLGRASERANGNFVLRCVLQFVDKKKNRNPCLTPRVTSFMENCVRGGGLLNLRGGEVNPPRVEVNFPRYVFPHSHAKKKNARFSLAAINAVSFSV